MLSGDVNIMLSSTDRSSGKGGESNSIFRCFRLSKLFRLRLFLPRDFLLLRNGLNVGDSSSSSTTIRRFRSFMMLVDGVVTIDDIPSVAGVVGDAVMIILLSFESGEMFVLAIKSETSRGDDIIEDAEMELLLNVLQKLAAYCKN